jgi:hypothetical protein
MSETYQIRKYGEKTGDYQLVDSWMKAHGRGPLPETLLPALGVFSCLDSEEIAVGWLYMDNSIGVCTLDFFVTRPGLAPKQTYEALEPLVTFLSQEAQELGYGAMTIYTVPGLARFAERFGFVRRVEGLVMLSKNLTT